jgi:ATP-dependent DNA ligase
VDLPLLPPIQPMLAKAAATVPAQPEGTPVWSYEPKWDGFRTIVFRDGNDVLLSSRGGKDLGRYFPEIVEAVRSELPAKCVIDGELVIARHVDSRMRLDWEALSARVHPAESRIQLLAQQTPAQFIAFDLLAVGVADLTVRPFAERRAALLEAIAAGTHCHVTRATHDAALAQEWFESFEGAGLDGVVAKRLDGPYVPNKREMVKVKHARTAEVVVMGYRPHTSAPGVGSVLLGLYEGGGLRMVGGMSAFTAERRVELQNELDELRTGDAVDGEQTRWRSSKESRWIPLRPERVVEVAYDQMEGDRFRHAVRFLRWRPDKSPHDCGFDQLEVPLRFDLDDVLAGDA